MYSYTESEEEDVKHGEDENAAEAYEQMLLKAGAITETKSEEEARLAKAAIEATRLVCSCGSYFCFAIGLYGLAKPTYNKEIVHLESQYIKDSTAARIKAAGG